MAPLEAGCGGVALAFYYKGSGESVGSYVPLSKPDYVYHFSSVVLYFCGYTLPHWEIDSCLAFASGDHSECGR